MSIKTIVYVVGLEMDGGCWLHTDQCYGTFEEALIERGRRTALSETGVRVFTLVTRNKPEAP